MTPTGHPARVVALALLALAVLFGVAVWMQWWVEGAR
jgi:hypothetical protein